MRTKPSFHGLAETVQQELKQVIAEISAEDVDRFVGELVNAKRVFLCGKGRTGLQMESFAMRLMHLGMQVFVVGDVTSPGIEADDLLVIGSASGKTHSMVGYAETAGQIGARLILITANSKNAITAQSEAVVVIPAPSHKNPDGTRTVASIQPLAGLFELALSALLNIIVLQLMAEIGVEESAMVSRHANLE